MNKILSTLLLIATMLLGISHRTQANEPKEKQIKTVVLISQINCQNCKNKIMKNIPFEKGVKDIEVSLENKTVTIKFQANKNTAESLCDAVTKLGYKSIIKEVK